MRYSVKDAALHMCVLGMAFGILVFAGGFAEGSFSIWMTAGACGALCFGIRGALGEIARLERLERQRRRAARRAQAARGAAAVVQAQRRAAPDLRVA